MEIHLSDLGQTPMNILRSCPSLRILAARTVHAFLTHQRSLIFLCLYVFRPPAG